MLRFLLASLLFAIASADWRDITCITFDESRDPFQGSQGIYVEHEGVELEDECGGPESAGQCGYFPEGRAYLKIPYFIGNSLYKFSISLWFLRSPDSPPDASQALINLYSHIVCAERGFGIDSLSARQLRIITFDVHQHGLAVERDTDPQEEWTHVVVTYDGSWDAYRPMTIKAYVNGQLQYTENHLRGSVLQGDGVLTIGIIDCNVGDRDFHGYMDTISFSKKVLTQEQVSELAADRSKCFPTA